MHFGCWNPTVGQDRTDVSRVPFVRGGKVGGGVWVLVAVVMLQMLWLVVTHFCGARTSIPCRMPLHRPLVPLSVHFTSKQTAYNIFSWGRWSGCCYSKRHTLLSDVQGLAQLEWAQAWLGLAWAWAGA